MQLEIDLDQTERKIVNQILRKHIPNDVEVWVFGSRATNSAKPFSDLDLALKTKHKSNTDREVNRKINE